MTETKSQNTEILYQDSNVKITQQSVTVLKFYFPHHTNKQVFFFKDINKLGLKEMDPMDQTLGVDSSFFDDFKKKTQQNCNMYIEMAVEDESVRLSFAPENPYEVFKLIEKKWEDSKIEAQKKSIQPLQQNKLYSNVQVSKESIEKALQQIKKSENQNVPLNDQNERKRKSPSPGRKVKQDEEGQNPKKKIKQSTKDQVNEQNLNPSLTA